MINTREQETKERMKDQLPPVFNQAEREMKETAIELEKNFRKKFAEGKEQIQHMVTNVDKQLKTNPWPIVGGIAATCLLLGFVLGTYRRGGE